MTSFARPSLLDNRFGEIAQTSVYTYDDDDLVNYAEFLKNHGRYKSKQGFVDSSRRIRSLHRQQEQLYGSQTQTPGSRGGILAEIKKSSSPALIAGGQTPGKSHLSKEKDAAMISANLESKRKDYEKQMRLIEEQMIKAKQSEREAKRLEGDIKKEQRMIRHSFRDLDVDTTKKKYSAEKNLAKNLGEKDQIEREFVKKREKQTRQRKDHLIDSLQSNKDKDRRNLLLCNDLARQYRTKTNELDVKHQQLTRIHSDFEMKIQQKELEESRIRKELKDIALALQLEAQKAKNDMSEFLSIVNQEHDKDSKFTFITASQKVNEPDRRRHSGDLSNRQLTLETKQRDALRRIGETKTRLDNVYARQRNLNSNMANISEQERRVTQLKSKINDIDQRRSQLANQYLREKGDRFDESSSEIVMQNKSIADDLSLKQHEDRLKQIQEVLTKNEEVEQNLRQSLKEAEFQRRKKEQEVHRLREELVKKKREDAKRIHEAIERAEQEEKALQRHIHKEKAKLDQVQARRENSYNRLTGQREYRREHKTLLKTHQREHERLLNAQSQSQSLQSLNTI